MATAHRSARSDTLTPSRHVGPGASRVVRAEKTTSVDPVGITVLAIRDVRSLIDRAHVVAGEVESLADRQLGSVDSEGKGVSDAPEPNGEMYQLHRQLTVLSAVVERLEQQVARLRAL